MADITLNSVTSGYNVSTINNNFDTIETIVNEGLLHKTGGNNVINQSIDMNSHSIINLITDEDDLHSAANVAYVNDVLAGEVGTALTVDTLVDNVRSSTSVSVLSADVVLTAEQSRAPFIKITNATGVDPRTVTITESADNPTNFIVQVSGDHNVTLEMDTLLTTYTLVPNRPYFFSYKFGVSCINLTEILYDELVLSLATGVLTSSAGVVTIDLSADTTHYSITLTENVTSLLFTNEPAVDSGITIMLQITNHASSPKTFAWPASFKWVGGSAGTISATNSAVDTLAITTFDSGTTWRATLANGFA